MVHDGSDITVLQLQKFKAEATALLGAGGIEAVAAYLISHPNAGQVIPGAGGARKLRWAAKGKGKRAGARIIYLFWSPDEYTCSAAMRRMSERI